MIKSVTQDSILYAGDLLTSPHRMIKKFLRFVHSHDEFKPYLEGGLAETILSAEKNARQIVFEMPQTVSWERVSSKLPRIYCDLTEALETEKKRFA